LIEKLNNPAELIWPTSKPVSRNFPRRGPFLKISYYKGKKGKFFLTGGKFGPKMRPQGENFSIFWGNFSQRRGAFPGPPPPPLDTGLPTSTSIIFPDI
jgi:hypothetical protein